MITDDFRLLLISKYGFEYTGLFSPQLTKIVNNNLIFRYLSADYEYPNTDDYEDEAFEIHYDLSGNEFDQVSKEEWFNTLDREMFNNKLEKLLE